MDVVKAFNSNQLHTEIVIKGTYDEPLFRASDIGEILEIANIRTTIQNFDDTEKVVHSMDTLGGIQQVTFLTEKGLYKVLFKSRKPIAEQFQNWVCEVIKELRLKGSYSLQQQLEQTNNKLTQSQQEHELNIIKTKELEQTNNKLTQSQQEHELNIIKTKELEKERILLEKYGNNSSLIYIIKVKTLNKNEYIIKIGESGTSLLARYKSHKSCYDECLLLDCFVVNNSRKFEQFIHSHENIRFNRVNYLQGHEKEVELFLIGKNLTYSILENIINTNMVTYDNGETERLKLEIERLKLENDNLKLKQNIIITPDTEKFNILIQQNNNLEKQINELLEKTNSSQIKTTTGFQEPLVTLGPRLQKINPENLQLIRIYEYVTELMKEDNKYKRPSINKAVIENTIYQGFRWALVDRDIDPNIVNIQPTTQTKIQNLGYIAKINQEKTEILNVYLDRKTAAVDNGYSISGLDTHVKKGSHTQGFYYILYDNCDDILKTNFVEKNNGNEPLLYKAGVGQYDSNNYLIKEHICKYDCIRNLCISDKTLAKALDKPVMYNTNFFKTIGSKTKCF